MEAKLAWLDVRVNAGALFALWVTVRPPLLMVATGTVMLVEKVADLAEMSPSLVTLNVTVLAPPLADVYRMRSKPAAAAAVVLTSNNVDVTVDAVDASDATGDVARLAANTMLSAKTRPAPSTYTRSVGPRMVALAVRTYPELGC